MMQMLNGNRNRIVALVVAVLALPVALSVGQSIAPPKAPSVPSAPAAPSVSSVPSVPKPEKPRLVPPELEKPGGSGAAKKVVIKSDPFPLDTCIIDGKKFDGGKRAVKMLDGREIRFCSDQCMMAFERDQKTFLKKIDQKIIEQQLPHYPLTMCVVMEDAKLDGGEDPPINFIYKNRLVRVCCRNCQKDFNDDPAKYLKKIDEAVIKQQKADYPLDSCPVSGEKLDDTAVEKVYGVTFVRFCCNNCVRQFEANPLPYMAKLHEAWKAKHGGADKESDGKKAGGDH